MKQTENYKLNLLETSDVLSAKPLNENMNTIEATLLAMDQTVAGKLVMMSGSYVGDGTTSASIQTPGMTPRLVLMPQFDKVVGNYADYSGQHMLDDVITRSGGWVLWAGEDRDAKFASQMYDEDDNPDGFYEPSFKIKFSAQKGSLSWETDLKNPSVWEKHASPVINNESGVTYRWFAFGTAE